MDGEGFHTISSASVSISAAEQSASRRSQIITRCCALICVGLAVIDWVVLAEVLQKLQRKDPVTGESYNRPLFLCFCIKTTYAVSFIPYILWKFTPLGGQGRNDVEPFSEKYLFTRGCILNVMGFVSGYTWYMSLPLTSVSANTAIYMCACAAVFLISIPLLREKITVIKVLSLIVCCVGIVLVSLFSEHKDPHKKPGVNGTTFTDNFVDHDSDTKRDSNVLGYILVLISMFLYASYEVFYGKLLQTDQDKHPAMTSLKFVGYLGVTTPILFGICLPIWHLAGWEILALPPADLYGMFFLSIFLDAVFNIFLLLAIALSNPTLASVGQSMALPGSMVADFIIHRFLMPYPALIGAGCVTVGFCGFVYEELKHDAPVSTISLPEDDDRQALLDSSSEERDLPTREKAKSNSSQGLIA